MKYKNETSKVRTISDDSVSKNKEKYLFIFEAAIEYLISILVAGSFLATLTKE